MHIYELENRNKIVFEDVKDQSTEEYFKGNKFSIDAFNNKYRSNEQETYVQAIKRVCDEIASVEDTEEKRKYWSDRWFDELYHDWWHPAGSIMQGAIRGRNISLANCSTVSLGTIAETEEWDNLESIVKNSTYTVSKMAAYRQGLGVDFSRLRPRGMSLSNSAKESTGAVHWMQFVDSIGYYVGQRGRIPALLFSISCSHPDVEEFIEVKKDYTKIQNANISVQCTDAFYDAVYNDEEWELKFEVPGYKKGDKIYIDIHSSDMESLIDENGKYYKIAKKDRESEVFIKKVRARDLLKLIAKNMTDNAEPGIQNIDIARKYSNSDYVYDPNDDYDSRIISTNACSEQYLSRESLCVLSSINMGKFSKNPEDYEKELSVIGESVNRFLDNVNEYEVVNSTYATPHQKVAIEKLRRTGAGYTNMCAWLLKCGLEYGEEDCNNSLEHFTQRYNFHLYRSSINLGREKGSFGLFNREKLEKSPFIQRMMGLGLEFDALRNVTCSSIAPTGSLSLQFRDGILSYGIEPAFNIYFWKRTRISGKYEYYFCVPYEVRRIFSEAGYPIPVESDSIKDDWAGSKGKEIVKFIEENKDKVGIKFKDSTSISPFKKLDLMSRVMKWIDSSISVTYMLPENSNYDDVYNFILEAHKREVKSIAAFPDKKMYGIVSFIPFRELAFKLKNEGINLHKQNFTEDESEQLFGVQELEGQIVKTSAPKRPKELPCEVHHTTIKGHNYYVIVSKYNNDPYEVFVGSNHDNQGEIIIPKSISEGTAVKIKRKKYVLSARYRNELKEYTLTNGNSDDNADALARLTSTSLRHGIDISFIVHQLEKTKGDMLSFAKVLARVLKTYIVDGTKVTGSSCPMCGSENIIRLEGCITCSDCSWSRCT